MAACGDHASAMAAGAGAPRVAAHAAHVRRTRAAHDGRAAIAETGPERLTVAGGRGADGGPRAGVPAAPARPTRRSRNHQPGNLRVESDVSARDPARPARAHAALSEPPGRKSAAAGIL